MQKTMTETAEKIDYSSTLYLPQTEFPMRAGLPQKEPETVARWQKMELYKKLRASAAGREKFVLHDGPPYANGNIHIGHALNKILKDVINRSFQMRGFDANYVRAGTATACRSNGRSRRNIARRAATRTTFRSTSSARNAATSPVAGSRSRPRSSSGLASRAISISLTRR